MLYSLKVIKHLFVYNKHQTEYCLINLFELRLPSQFQNQELKIFNYRNTILSLILLLSSIITASAAAIADSTHLIIAAATPEMADTMRSDGKIWVVVAVIITILLGLIIYLITVDRKITSIEKKLDSSKKQ